jgi:hypothetical protein
MPGENVMAFCVFDQGALRECCLEEFYGELAILYQSEGDHDPVKAELFRAMGFVNYDEFHVGNYYHHDFWEKGKVRLVFIMLDSDELLCIMIEGLVNYARFIKEVHNPILVNQRIMMEIFEKEYGDIQQPAKAETAVPNPTLVPVPKRASLWGGLKFHRKSETGFSLGGGQIKH